MQNELLEAMALGMMRQISANIQNAAFLSIMADKAADVSNKEQLFIWFGGMTMVLWYAKISLECILWKEQMQIK